MYKDRSPVWENVTIQLSNVQTLCVCVFESSQLLRVNELSFQEKLERAKTSRANVSIIGLFSVAHDSRARPIEKSFNYVRRYVTAPKALYKILSMSQITRCGNCTVSPLFKYKCHKSGRTSAIYALHAFIASYGSSSLESIAIGSLLLVRQPKTWRWVCHVKMLQLR